MRIIGPTPLDIYLLYYLLRGLSLCFLLLEHVIANEWDFKPNAKAQVLAPTTLQITQNINFFSLDISVFLSLPYTFEVYLRHWSFLEGCLEQEKAHFIDICQIRGG